MEKYIYCAKQLLSREDWKYILLSCPSSKEVHKKNECFEKLLQAFSLLGVAAVGCNCDSSLQSKNADVIDGTQWADQTAFHLEKMNRGAERIALINLPAVLGNAHLLSADPAISGVVLSTVYGVTSYRDMEKTKHFLAENKIEILGVISCKK